MEKLEKQSRSGGEGSPTDSFGPEKGGSRIREGIAGVGDGKGTRRVSLHKNTKSATGRLLLEKGGKNQMGEGSERTRASSAVSNIRTCERLCIMSGPTKIP